MNGDIYLVAKDGAEIVDYMERFPVLLGDALTVVEGTSIQAVEGRRVSAIYLTETVSNDSDLVWTLQRSLILGLYSSDGSPWPTILKSTWYEQSLET